MTHEYILWIATIAYGFHMIEETVYDWHGWVRRVLKLQAEWHEFYMVNAVVIVLGAGCAMVGWRCPTVALIFPAFMVVNALLFHVLPVLVTRIFSPGVALPGCLAGRRHHHERGPHLRRAGFSAHDVPHRGAENQAPAFLSPGTSGLIAPSNEHGLAAVCDPPWFQQTSLWISAVPGQPLLVAPIPRGVTLKIKRGAT